MTKRKDEYNEIYEVYEGSGFTFDYNNGRLSHSKNIFVEDVNRINPSKRNNDGTPLYVNCRPCGSYMDFIPGPRGELDGYWRCPACGTKVRERTIYTQLSRENIAFMSCIEQDDDDEPDWL
jgi:rubredoxin